MKNQFITVNNIKIRYVEQGEQHAQTLILLHGLGGSVENWLQNIPTLSQHFHVIALDLPGFGLSEKPNRVYHLELFEQTLVAFMDALHIDKATLVGNSMGGGLALMMAIDHPKRVDKLVLCAAAGFSRRLPVGFKLLTIRFINRLILKPTLKKCRMGLRNVTVQHDFITPEFIETHYHYNCSPGAVHAFLSILSNFASFSGIKKKFAGHIENNLQNIQQPTLVIWGNEDPLLPLKYARDNLSKLTNYQLKVYENCGHVPQCEMPEKFNHDVSEFLLQSKQA